LAGDAKQARPAAKLTPLPLLAETGSDNCGPGERESLMRRFMIALVAAAALAAPLTAAGGSGGLSPKQLNDQGWTCFNVPGLGVHCSAPGQEWPPTGPTAQLLYFFNTTDPASDVPDFTGTETLLRDDYYRGQPCPTEASGEYNFLGDLGGGASYWGCHRR